MIAQVKRMDVAARPGWRVIQLLAMGERGVRVTLAKGANRFHLMAPEFGVGRPKKAAALARFAGASGLGDVQEIFDFLVALPADYDDVIPLPFSQEFFFLEP